MKTWLHSLTTGEKALWAVSSAAILLSYAFFGGQGWLTLAASLIGVTSLLLAAKGHYMGQALMIVFSLLYGGVPHLSPQPLVCRGLCRQRCGLGALMAAGLPGRPPLFIHGGLLSGLPDGRSLRLCQLAADGPPSGSVTIKVEPHPGLESTCTLPPHSSTARCTTDSPSPLPRASESWFAR